MELHPEPYSETDFINYIRSVIQPLGEAKGIHFHIPPQELFNCRILVDKLKYNQIFFNLLSNAVKFTPPGGHDRMILKVSYAKEVLFVLFKKKSIILVSALVSVMENGESVEFGETKELFDHAKDERTREYMSYVL